MYKILVQEIVIPSAGERFATNEKVNAALEDIANGNRPLTSRAMIKCRLAEIAVKRQKEAKDFKAWAERTIPLP
ncbi:MAG TPA: hypothetical protein VN843_29290 [Anaerolineales bacterium]|nr:hypothetical protein [Anaerolineales bacterium]